MRALVWKELRENIHWFPIGVIVVGVTCWITLPSSIDDALIAMNLTRQLAIVAPLLAFALGMVQSFRDLQPAAGAYLNHRSITASNVFFAKLLAGLGLYAVAIALPILCFAGWIAYQGMGWIPIRPAQVVPALVFGFASFMMHPAAMLMMARNASWWGTKVFPLIPVGAALMLFFVYLPTGGLQVAGICALISLTILLLMIAVACQGWCELQTNPPRARKHSRLFNRMLVPGYLIVGCLTCLTLVVLSIAGAIEIQGHQSKVYVPKPYSVLAINRASGQPWILTYSQKIDEVTGTYEGEVALGGDSIENRKAVDPMRPLTEQDQFTKLVRLRGFNAGYDSTDGFFSRIGGLLPSSLVYTYDSRGYLICYTRNSPRTLVNSRHSEFRWTHTIAASGVQSAGQLLGDRFYTDAYANGHSTFNSLTSSTNPPLLIDSKGVYSLETNPLSIRRLIDHPIDAAALLNADDDHAPRLVIQSGDELLEYQFLDGNGEDTWFKRIRNTRFRIDKGDKLPVTAKRIATYQMPNVIGKPFNWSLALNEATLFATNHDSPKEVYRLSPEGGVETIAFDLVPTSKNATDDDRPKPELVVAGLLPGLVPVTAGVVFTWLGVTGQVTESLWEQIASLPVQATTFFASFSMVTLLAVWLTVLASRRRGLTRRQTMAWCWSVLLLGLAAPLSIIAIYRQVQREACPDCNRSRRVDTDTCEHCAAPWEPPANEGIEICDHQSLAMIPQLDFNGS